MKNCIFEPRTDTSSATICKNCGKEKVFHNHNIQVPQLYTEEQTNEKINLAIQEFERLKSKAKSLKDILYLNGVLAVLEGIKNQSLKQTN